MFHVFGTKNDINNNDDNNNDNLYYGYCRCSWQTSHKTRCVLMASISVNTVHAHVNITVNTVHARVNISVNTVHAHVNITVDTVRAHGTHLSGHGECSWQTSQWCPENIREFKIVRPPKICLKLY